MLRRSDRLQIVAENEHFACSDHSRPIRSQIDVLVLKTCQKEPLFGTFSGRVRGLGGICAVRFQDEYVDPGSYRSGLVAARKVMVLCDFLELGESPQHRVHAYACSQSIGHVVEVFTARQPPGLGPVMFFLTNVHWRGRTSPQGSYVNELPKNFARLRRAVIKIHCKQPHPLQEA